MSLAEEIAKGETQNLEFKLIPNQNRVKYLKTAVAFANGRGGRILFGVANDRRVAGIVREVTGIDVRFSVPRKSVIEQKNRH